MLKDTMKGALVAGMVASLFAGGFAHAKDDKTDAKVVKCSGVNGCKGKGACAGKDNSCAGANSCKGKGWIKVAEKDCKGKGGTIVP